MGSSESMTKHVRIENADNSDYTISVEVWEKYGDNEPVLVKTVPLLYPTTMATEYITTNRYILIKEGFQKN